MNHNFLLGNGTLCYVPFEASFPNTNWEGCVHETAIRNILNLQQPPVVNHWTGGGLGSLSSSSSGASMPPPSVVNPSTLTGSLSLSSLSSSGTISGPSATAMSNEGEDERDNRVFTVNDDADEKGSYGWP